ncbi:MAG: tetratricopeptide repeat protein [bacterium]
MKIVKQFDNFDRLNCIIIAALIILIAVMILNEKGEVTSAVVDQPSISPIKNKILREEDQKIYKLVFEHEEKRDFQKALSEINNIIQNKPDRAQSLVYQARLYRKQAMLGKSAQSYRRALEADSKFLDKNYYLFINKEVIALLSSAIPKFKREKNLKPNDSEVKQTLRDLYYLRRKVAGGCE